MKNSSNMIISRMVKFLFFLTCCSSISCNQKTDDCRLVKTKDGIEFYVVGPVAKSLENRISIFIETNYTKSCDLLILLNKFDENLPYYVQVKTENGITRAYLKFDPTITVAKVDVIFERFSFYQSYRGFTKSVCASVGLEEGSTIPISSIDSLCDAILYNVRSNINSTLSFIRTTKINEEGELEVKLIFYSPSLATVAAVKCSGLDTSLAKALEKYIKISLKPNANWNTEQRGVIQELTLEYLREQGYSDACISSFAAFISPDSSVDVYMHIDAGQRLIIDDVSLVFSAPLPIDPYRATQNITSITPGRLYVARNAKNAVSTYEKVLEDANIVVLSSSYSVQRSLDGRVSIAYYFNVLTEKVFIKEINIESNFQPNTISKFIKDRLQLDSETGLLIFNKNTIKKSLDTLLPDAIFSKNISVKVVGKKAIVDIQVTKRAGGSIGLQLNASLKEANIQLSADNAGLITPMSVTRTELEIGNGSLKFANSVIRNNSSISLSNSSTNTRQDVRYGVRLDFAYAFNPNVTGQFSSGVQYIRSKDEANPSCVGSTVNEWKLGYRNSINTKYSGVPCTLSLNTAVGIGKTQLSQYVENADKGILYIIKTAPVVTDENVTAFFNCEIKSQWSTSNRSQVILGCKGQICDFLRLDRPFTDLRLPSLQGVKGGTKTGLQIDPIIGDKSAIDVSNTLLEFRGQFRLNLVGRQKDFDPTLPFINVAFIRASTGLTEQTRDFLSEFDRPFFSRILSKATITDRASLSVITTEIVIPISLTNAKVVFGFHTPLDIEDEAEYQPYFSIKLAREFQ